VLGEELRKARLDAKMTQEEVAAKAGITREYVSHLERDEYSPTLDVLLPLCKAIGTRAWKIVQTIEEPRSTK
jgi:transcriptional regulator with XRE-family HTH domain